MTLKENNTMIYFQVLLVEVILKRRSIFKRNDSSFYLSSEWGTFTRKFSLFFIC